MPIISRFGTFTMAAAMSAFVLAPAACAATVHPAHGVKTPAKSHAKARAVHHLAHGRYRYNTYFVPPPPAYMPSILPELSVRSASGAEAADLAKKPENPYSKYVRTPEGDSPAPLQTRKGVVTWSRRS